jgi:transcriptional regulator with XRE-family HTH domain
LRISHKHTQEYVADLLKLSVSGYAKLENGATELTIARVEEIAKVYNMSGIDLIAFAVNDKICINNSNNTGTVGNNGIINVNMSKEEAKKETELSEIKDLLLLLLTEMRKK